MSEMEKEQIVASQSLRCSNCIYGKQIVAGVFRANVNEAGAVTEEHLIEPIPIGQTRNCFGPSERILSRLGFVELDHYVFPGEDDRCIYPERFRPK